MTRTPPKPRDPKTKYRRKRLRREGSSGDSSTSNQKPWLRLVLVWTFFLLAQVGLVGRLAWIQIHQGQELKNTAAAQQRVKLSPKVGLRPILDRNGNVLAKDVASFRLFLHPFLFEVTPEEIVEALDPLLKKDKSELMALVQSADSGIPIAYGSTALRAGYASYISIYNRLSF